MKHKTLFSLGAIVLIIYGLLWLILPAVGLNMYGHNVVATDLASIIARYWGSAFVGLAIILWLSRDADAESVGVKAVISGGFVMCVTGFVVGLIDKFFGNPNAMIWVTVALYGLFSIWFGMLLFKK